MKTTLHSLLQSCLLTISQYYNCITPAYHKIHFCKASLRYMEYRYMTLTILVPVVADQAPNTP